MRIAVDHTTRYAFARPVAHGLQRLRMTPKNTHGQQVIEWDMGFEGAVREVEYDDHHHNHTVLVSLEPGATALTVSCKGLVATADNAGVIGAHAGHMPLWAFLAPTALTRPGARLKALAARLEAPPGDTIATLHALVELVRGAIAYTLGATHAATTAEDAAALGAGVCQDHAHAFIALARMLGIPARYVGGYLLTDGRIEHEAGHAWAEAHVEHLGWVGFDVSNGISPDERYVRVATGRDYREAAPLTGITWGEGEAMLDVKLSVMGIGQ